MSCRRGRREVKIHAGRAYANPGVVMMNSIRDDVRRSGSLQIAVTLEARVAAAPLPVFDLLAGPAESLIAEQRHHEF
jgi:hypothetical protein